MNAPNLTEFCDCLASFLFLYDHLMQDQPDEFIHRLECFLLRMVERAHQDARRQLMQQLRNPSLN
jgi:hypothetical protein